jgi:hypothetical protein
MSETNDTKNIREDELDLIDLFKRMGRSINKMAKSLGKGFLITSVFIIRRWLPLGFSIVLGVGISFLFKFASESSYTSDLVLKTNAVTPADMISYLNRLHTYCDEENTNALSQALSLDPKQLTNVFDISAFWIIDKGKDNVPDHVDYNNNHDIYDTLNVRMHDRLDIRVRIKEPQELSTFKNGIIKFIYSDSLFQQLNRVRLRQNQELLSRLNNDILQLDSLQKVKYFEETRSRKSENGGQMIFLQEQKTQLVYSDTYTLYARKQVLEADRDLYKDIVTILSEFTIPARRDNGGMYYAKLVVPLMFVFTLLLLIIMANRKKLEEVFRKY